MNNETVVTTFTRACGDLIADHVIPAIVEHLNKTGRPTTSDELMKVMNLPTVPRPGGSGCYTFPAMSQATITPGFVNAATSKGKPRKTTASTATESSGDTGCMHKMTRGKTENIGKFCGKKRVGETMYCTTHKKDAEKEPPGIPQVASPNSSLYKTMVGDTQNGGEGVKKITVTSIDKERGISLHEATGFLLKKSDDGSKHVVFAKKLPDGDTIELSESDKATATTMGFAIGDLRDYMPEKAIKQFVMPFPVHNDLPSLLSQKSSPPGVAGGGGLPFPTPILTPMKKN